MIGAFIHDGPVPSQGLLDYIKRCNHDEDGKPIMHPVTELSKGIPEADYYFIDSKDVSSVVKIIASKGLILGIFNLNSVSGCCLVEADGTQCGRRQKYMTDELLLCESHHGRYLPRTDPVDIQPNIREELSNREYNEMSMKRQRLFMSAELSKAERFTGKKSVLEQSRR